jgi:hypothetical protein
LSGEKDQVGFLGLGLNSKKDKGDKDCQFVHSESFSVLSSKIFSQISVKKPTVCTAGFTTDTKFLVWLI